MKWGLSGANLPADLRYANVINAACWIEHFSPPLAYAVAWHESIQGEVGGLWPSAAAVVSADGGHGLFQLTSWVPEDWADAHRNAYYAVADWLAPDAQRWFREYGLTGEALVRCTAASFNAGFARAAGAHAMGDVDAFTTDRYGEKVLAIYQLLLKNGSPR